MKRNTKSSFDSLFFTIDNCGSETVPPTHQDIPKTIIFIDSKLNIRRAVNQLRVWIQRKCPAYTMQQLMEVVRFYHADIADADKILISDTFHHADSPIRILVATDAVGLGVNLPNVERVVQYGLPKEPDMAGIWQRFGRA